LCSAAFTLAVGLLGSAVSSAFRGCRPLRLSLGPALGGGHLPHPLLPNSQRRTHKILIVAYSNDLREQMVETKERGMPTVEVARTFGVGLSSVKRYAKVAREGGSLRPKRSLGRRPKADERVRRLLEADLRERPAATLAQRREYLRGVAGLSVLASPQSAGCFVAWAGPEKRRVGASERELEFLRAAWRVLVAGKIDAERLVFVDERGTRTPRWRRCRPGCCVARERAAP
jgi:transposase